MSHFHNNMLLGSAGNQGAYEIERSLRFDSGSSTYLYRTPSSAGNQKKYTISVWVKRTAFLASLLDVSFLGAGDGTTYGISGTGAFGAAYNGHVFIRNGGVNVGYWDIEFRDPSAWYHFVLAIDTDQGTAANRNRLYVNGVEQSAPTASLGSGVSTNINAASIHSIGTFNLPASATPFAGYYTNAYLAEYNFIDGSQLDHTSFGETDTTTGAWIPKKYVGSYGTNGFYLNFSDNSSAAALGTDSSGNGNNWTPNNFSVTPGADDDSMEDTPTNNYSTLNPLDKTGGTMSDGNLTYTGVYSDVITLNGHGSRSTLKVPPSGKWYVEAANITAAGSGNSCMLGFTSSEAVVSSSGAFAGTLTPWIGVDASVFNGKITMSTNGAGSSVSPGTILFPTPPALVSGDIVNFAIDFDNGKFWVGKKGTWYNSGDPAAGTNATATFTAGSKPWAFWAEYVASGNNVNRSKPRVNFGQQGFEYTAPSGFLAMNTANLPEPTIKNGTDYFNTVLYEGNVTLRSISGVGFQPDFVWLKRRSSTAVHGLWDVVRGASNYLVTNNTDTEQNDTTNGLQDFETDGFELGPVATWNGNTETYVAWNWKAGGSGSLNQEGTIDSTVSVNTAAGFSIVKWAAEASAGTIGHGLGAAPQFIIMKDLDTDAYPWLIYHEDIGIQNYLQFTTTGKTGNATAFSTAPTSTVFDPGTGVTTGNSYGNLIAYCFAEVEGYSKFGGYTGNGGNNYIHCGFRPAWIMTKRDGSSNWYIFDTTRKENLVDNPLQANDPGQETSGYNNNMDILSNGFCWKSSDAGGNGTGSTYVFMAFGETPFKYANAR